jgi:hypothetical protein
MATLRALLSLGASFLIAASSLAQVHVVNPDGSGDFLTIQEAIDSNSVAAGDTIFVVYGIHMESVNVNKRVTLMGGGYHADDGYPTQIFAIQGPAITISSQASGSRIEGFRIRALANRNAIVVEPGTSNIEIRENLLETESGYAIYWDQATGGVIEHNFSHNTAKGDPVYLLRPTGLIVRNNVFHHAGHGIQVNGQGADTGLIVHNNVLRTAGGHTGIYMFSMVSGSTEVYSNIVVHAGSGPIYSISAQPFLIAYNHYWRTSGSINHPAFAQPGSHTDGDPLFENFPAATQGFNLLENDFRLQSGSPARNTGRIGPQYVNTDGTRNTKGIYGGPGPFVGDGGAPDFPVVTSIEVTPARVSVGGTIQIRVVGRVGQ